MKSMNVLLMKIQFLPDDVRYASYFNRDRDAINAAIFEEHCKEMHGKYGHTNDAIMVFSDKLRVKNSTDQSIILFNNCWQFWETCGEDNIKLPRGAGRMDPVLRLYLNC